MARTHNLKVGQEVKFRPTHDTHTEMAGTISEVSDDHDLVTITAHPDGKAIEVERDFQAHAPNVTVIGEAPKRRQKNAE